MAKTAKGTTAKKATKPAVKTTEAEEKNPLLDDEEETTDESTDETSDDEETEESSDDEASEDDSDEAEQEEAPAPKPTAKKPAAATTTAQEASAPAEGGNIQDGLLSDAQATKVKLDKAEKVFFMVPLSPFEKEGAIEEVFINGYRYTIKKGSMVQVPRPVMEILANKYKVEMEAGNDFKIDRTSATEDALS